MSCLFLTHTYGFSPPKELYITHKSDCRVNFSLNSTSNYYNKIIQKKEKYEESEYLLELFVKMI